MHNVSDTIRQVPIWATTCIEQYTTLARAHRLKVNYEASCGNNYQISDDRFLITPVTISTNLRFSCVRTIAEFALKTW